ncbi:hypothetical protein INR76_05990 [Marixanthomonas sp. SCSIO 43207]|uniref:hypothetical protein n=1 Tax=Marixanthomonas sp. SCSIO 43207 TaxID=2779360 RepID=UPI001CA996B6|nr:hypothetical protein [Marixanthomonas sp. SCSIO 43207]UAB82308.1 hypothetical protein INR76_05990 [Marixanthomonas sp. SCSIO 43207]
MKKTFLIALTLLILSCKTETKIENPNGIYSDAELIELNGMVSDFDEILTSKYKTENIVEAYHEFSKIVAEENRVPIPKGLEDLSDKVLDLKVFDKIWRKNIDQHVPGKFYLNSNGEYLSYLEYIGKKSEFINIYVDEYKSAHDILPSIIDGFSTNIKELDLTNKNYRLIFAVHYLTLINR